MKGYKRIYCSSLTVVFLESFIIGIPGALICDIVLSLFGVIEYGKISVATIVAFICTMILCALFMIVMSLIINYFKEPSVWVSEDSITYEGMTLMLDKIEYLTLYLPKMKSRTNMQIQELSLYISDKEHIVIRRPSPSLIKYLKRRCDNAKFEIDELQERIKSDLIISLCVTVATVVIAYFMAKQ